MTLASAAFGFGQPLRPNLMFLVGVLALGRVLWWIRTLHIEIRRHRDNFLDAGFLSPPVSDRATISRSFSICRFCSNTICQHTLTRLCVERQESWCLRDVGRAVVVYLSNYFQFSSECTVLSAHSKVYSKGQQRVSSPARPSAQQPKDRACTPHPPSRGRSTHRASRRSTCPATTRLRA